MRFCTEAQFHPFMQHVPEFEHMLYEDGVEIVRFLFSISKDVQAPHFDSRRTDRVKQWKISPVDENAQERWDVYTQYEETMFIKTYTSYSLRIIARANDKKKARLESVRHVPSAFNYQGNDTRHASLLPGPDMVLRYHRSNRSID